jgi:predicted esterase
MLNARFLLLFAAGLACAGQGKDVIVSDPDSDCYYVSASVPAGVRVPALLILHCNGAVKKDLDTFRLIGDSLGWILATCHATRNHRDTKLNDADITRTAAKLLARYPVDSSRLFVFGFSGQGVQALATTFLHPQTFRGLVATCPHAAAVPLANWDALGSHFAYLVTRQKDWNRAENEKMYVLFNQRGLETELEMTPGEHGPGPAKEVLQGCRWLASRLKD